MTTRDRLQLLPDLPPKQYDALTADIAERGVVVANDMEEFGQILDGHHNARAYRELGINDYPVGYPFWAHGGAEADLFPQG